MVSKRHPLTSTQLSSILTKAQATDGQKRAIRAAVRQAPVTDATSFRNAIRRSHVTSRSNVISARLMRAFREVTNTKTLRRRPRTSKSAMVLSPFPVRRLFM